VDPNRPVEVRDMSLAAQQAPQLAELEQMSPSERAALSQPAEAFGMVPFGPGSPMRPSPINALGPAGIAMPRRWQYPVGFNLPIPPGATKLVNFRTLRALADVEAILRRCIEARKQEIAQLDWQIVPRNPRDKTDYSDAIKGLARFFRTPDRINGVNIDDWLKMALEDVFVVDAMSIYRRPNRRGELHSLQLVDGTTIKPLIDQWGNRPTPPDPAYQQFLYGLPSISLSAGAELPSYDQAAERGQNGNIEATPLTTAELIYRPYVRRTWTPYGFPNIEQIILTVNLALKRTQWHTAFFTEGNVPDMFGFTPENYNPQQVREMQELWDQLLAGDIQARRKIKWLPGGARVQEVMDATKIHILDFDEFLVKVICAGMDVQPQEIGFAQDVNRAQGQMQENVTYRRSLRPIISWLQTIFNEVIEQDFGLPELCFKFLGIEWEDQEVQANIAVKLVEKGIRTIDEVRVNTYGEEPLAEGLGSEPVVITGRTVVRLRDVLSGATVMANTGIAPSPPDTTIGQPPMVEAAAESAIAAESITQTAMPDLAKVLGDYERFVLGRLRKGRPLRPFVAPECPEDFASNIHAELVELAERDALTTAAVKTVFAEALEPTPA
jgi:hypothetical protein